MQKTTDKNQSFDRVSVLSEFLYIVSFVAMITYAIKVILTGSLS